MILIFFLYCLAEFLLARGEQRRRVPVRQTILRSAVLLFFFTATVSVLAGLRVWLSVGLGTLVTALFPLQVAGVASAQKAVREARSRSRNRK